MSFPAAMETMARLTASAEALAALAARLRADAEGIALDPAVEAALDGVLEELGIAFDALQPAERATLAQFARAFLRQANDLVEHPEHPPGWAYEDDVVLLSLGRGSASIAGAFACVAELEEALSRPGAAVLDVGAGVAALSVALARRWPGLRVVGLEPWPFAMRHARADGRRPRGPRRVARRPDRGPHRLRRLRRHLAGDALHLARRHPGRAGAIARGAEAGWMGRLSASTPLRPTRFRSGWSPCARRAPAARWRTEAEACAALAAAGFTDTREVPRDWPAPVRLVLGTKG